MYRIGWFSTGRDEAARDLLTTVQQAIQRGEITAELAFVFITREPGESVESDRFFKLVESYNLPLVYISYQKYKATHGVANPDPAAALPEWRLDYDREAMQRLEGFHIDLGVLAGYMLITGPEMCRRYNLINLHPAAPGGPKGTWQQVIWQLIGEQASETGVMMHLVTPELDMGPPVTYCTFPIRGGTFDEHWQEIDQNSIDKIQREQGENNALFRLIRQHGLAREFPLIVKTIKAFSEGKVKITADKRVVDADGHDIIGYDLTEEINKTLTTESGEV